MSDIIIVGVAGPARSGKNEFASYATRKYDFYEDSFAGPLRRFMMDILGIQSLSQLDAVKERPSEVLGGKTPRFGMQTIGTEWGREMISDSLWVDSCMERIQRNCKSGLAVVSDVRFVNEAQAIKNAGGIIIKVDRPSVRINESSHVSEAGIPDEYITDTIINDGSLDNYYKMVDDVLHRHIWD